MGKPKMVQITKRELTKMQNRIKAEERKKAKKLERKFDGLSPHTKTKCRQALREIWYRSQPRKICVDRVSLPGGYFRCEHPECKKKKYPKTTIDHIVPIGEIDGGFLTRLFVPSTGLRSLCQKHHQAKTNAENAKRLAKKKKTVADFY